MAQSNLLVSIAATTAPQQVDMLPLSKKRSARSLACGAYARGIKYDINSAHFFIYLITNTLDAVQNHVLMQVGEKPIEVGLPIYDTCLKFGAIIATGMNKVLCSIYIPT